MNTAEASPIVDAALARQLERTEEAVRLYTSAAMAVVHMGQRQTRSLLTAMHYFEEADADTIGDAPFCLKTAERFQRLAWTQRDAKRRLRGIAHRRLLALVELATKEAGEVNAAIAQIDGLLLTRVNPNG